MKKRFFENVRMLKKKKDMVQDKKESYGSRKIKNSNEVYQNVFYVCH